MSELAIIALFLGLLAVAGGAYSILAPAQVRAGVKAFPRSIWPGRILVAIDLIWAAYELTRLHLGMFDAWKVNLYWLTPVMIFLCINYLDELLSPRALGGLLLLAAGPILNSARWHPSEWRLVITSLVYLWILMGLLFLLSPWWFNRIASWATGRGDSAVRITGAMKALVGVGLIMLALFVY